MIDLYSTLSALEKDGRIPTIRAYNRIDGPGSSLDLREFQEALWRLPDMPIPDDEEEFAYWSRDLPRTVGITIDVGCRVEARPFARGQIGIVSDDYGYHEEAAVGNVPFRKEQWLLKVLDLFKLSGVQMILHNLVPGIKSSGLGGSATATTAVCLLANELAGAPFSGEQIVAIASLIEQDMGISITGTQEQSNVVYGGVTDYVWFPWGIPNAEGAYGTSLRRTLLQENHYPELAARMHIYHSGRERASTDVNTIWRERLSDNEGFSLHLKQVATAYEFREGLRLRDWPRTCRAVKEYRSVRVKLCPDYMTSECWDIQGQCENYGAESFPLGAGGGGAVLIVSPSPERLSELGQVLSTVYRRINFKLRPHGHEITNLPGRV
jgi:Predicted kinase related to galactokinase and mevalonate kinase